jgi:hypothetical protein
MCVIVSVIKKATYFVVWSVIVWIVFVYLEVISKYILLSLEIILNI